MYCRYLNRIGSILRGCVGSKLRALCVVVWLLPKSNWSRAGGGGSLIAGGNVAGDSLGNGHSNCGGMRVRGSWGTPSVS